jgi:sigma-B regulation protein RsbU (phosphoserine phosphatase)
LDALNQNPAAAPEELLANVKRSVSAFVGDAEQFDDMTMLCLDYKGKPE